MKTTRLTPFIVTSFIVCAETAISFNSALLPNLKDEFAISNQLAQLTISGGLFSLGFSGMIYGGLTDSLGRRPILLFSIGIFSIMALLCCLAPNIEIFMFARFLQGIGSGAGWVIGNACIKDLYNGNKYIKIMNYIHAVAGIIPAVAPVIGSYLAVFIGWRNCFYGLFIFSGLSALFMYLFQAETLQKKKPIDPTQISKDYKTTFSNLKFLTYCFVKVITVMLLFCEVSNLSLIFINHLNVPAQFFGFYMLPVFLIYAISSLLSGYLNNFFSVNTIISSGLFFITLSNIAVLICYAITPLSAAFIQSLKLFTYIGWGLIFGNATAKIVSSVPGKAGMTSSIMIALEMLFSSIGIYILSFFFNGTIIPLSIFMLIFSMLAYIIFYISMISKENHVFLGR